MEKINKKTGKDIIDDLFVTIPKGTVEMRDNRTKRNWSVDIDSFRLAKHPVTQDIYDETVYGTYRVFRGGGWCDHERSVMATTRRRSHPLSFKIDDLGFRIATIWNK